MNYYQAEMIIKSLDRIATALETINDLGVAIWTAYDPVEVKGIITVKED